MPKCKSLRFLNHFYMSPFPFVLSCIRFLLLVKSVSCSTYTCTRHDWNTSIIFSWKIFKPTLPVQTRHLASDSSVGVCQGIFCKPSTSLKGKYYQVTEFLSLVCFCLFLSIKLCSNHARHTEVPNMNALSDFWRVQQAKTQTQQQTCGFFFFKILLWKTMA